MNQIIGSLNRLDLAKGDSPTIDGPLPASFPSPMDRRLSVAQLPRNVLRIIPLGGLGEVGKNMLALEFEDDIIIIDAGIMFPEEGMPGVDLIIPDPTYVLERSEKIRAILITHGHEDHTGALPYLLHQIDAPVYAPTLAHGLIQVKLREHHLLHTAELHEIVPGTEFQFGSFKVVFFRVCHSIPDAMGLAIETPLGLVIHTGDFKFDHTPIDGLATDFTFLSRVSQNGVLLLLSDSTYAELPGYTPSESVISASLDRIIGEAPGRVIVATFSSLISRIQQTINAANNHSRVVAIVGRSMVENVKMALSMGYLKDPGNVLRQLNQLKNVPLHQIVIITTGSQGEPTSGLVRIANQDHRDIQVCPDDTIIISASPIPGNETLINRTINNLSRLGARILHSQNELVHVRGHASREELKLMIRMTRPKYFVPIHGEYRHLIAHIEIAKSMGVPAENTFLLEDGRILELRNDTASITSEFACGHIFIAARQLWDSSDPVFGDRKILSKDGVILVIINVGVNNGRLVQLPSLVSSGFLWDGPTEKLFHEGATRINNLLNDYADIPKEWSSIEPRAKDVLRRFIYSASGFRPIILPFVLKMGTPRN